jgi:hypothetical protein
MTAASRVIYFLGGKINGRPPEIRAAPAETHETFHTARDCQPFMKFPAIRAASRHDATALIASATMRRDHDFLAVFAAVEGQPVKQPVGARSFQLAAFNLR